MMMNLTLELYSNLIPLKLDEIYILLLNLYSLIEINNVFLLTYQPLGFEQQFNQRHVLAGLLFPVNP